jgi:hypothetical protein
LYDANQKQYFNWDGKGLKNVTSKIKVPLYNEEHDSPSNPASYGIMGWHEGDSAVYIYDRYDVWKIDPAGVGNPVNMTTNGRKTNTQYRFVRLDTTERFLRHGQTLYFRTQNQNATAIKLIHRTHFYQTLNSPSLHNLQSPIPPFLRSR